MSYAILEQGIFQVRPPTQSMPLGYEVVYVLTNASEQLPARR